jgi:very-short-patch-repair endonuclease
MARRRTERARRRRKEPTDAEARLSGVISAIGKSTARSFAVRRSCWAITPTSSARRRLIVEADGGQHSAEHDAERTKALEAAGHLVIRFWNNDILENTEGVIDEIRRALRHGRGPR